MRAVIKPRAQVADQFQLTVRVLPITQALAGQPAEPAVLQMVLH